MSTTTPIHDEQAVCSPSCGSAWTPGFCDPDCPHSPAAYQLEEMRQGHGRTRAFTLALAFWLAVLFWIIVIAGALRCFAAST